MVDALPLFLEQAAIGAEMYELPLAIMSRGSRQRERGLYETR